MLCDGITVPFYLLLPCGPAVRSWGVLCPSRTVSELLVFGQSATVVGIAVITCGPSLAPCGATTRGGTALILLAPVRLVSLVRLRAVCAVF